MIPTVSVHEAQPLVPSGDVDQLVYPREQKAVLQTGVIKVGVVGTHPPLAIFLLHNRSVG